jgi:hypothetical protein
MEMGKLYEMISIKFSHLVLNPLYPSLHLDVIIHVIFADVVVFVVADVFIE